MILALLPAALAEGYSLDIELVRPSFSGAPPGIDAPEVQKQGAVTAGAVVQYQSNPLVLVVEGEELGSVVGNRLAVHAGASVDVSRRVAVRATLPVAFSFGSELDALAADGFGAGDMSAGLRFELLENDLLALGAHGDLYVPIARPASYLGEASLRFAPGVAFALSPGDFRFEVDASFMLRGVVPTQETLGLGQELTAAADVSYALLDGRLRPHLLALARVGLSPDLASDSTFPVEVLGGAQVGVHKEWWIDAYGGKGLTAGYGATDARAVLAVTYQRVPEDAKPVETLAPVYTAEVSDAELDKIIEEEPEPEPEPEKPLAVVTQKEIVIRDALRFAAAKDIILSESMPTLEFVAQLMNENADIQTLIIEGHASGEGTFESNYELSVDRALAVFKFLVESGVHPSRLAIRGYGEVMPVKEGDDAANRRVVFAIARRLAVGEPNPGWETEIKLPWNGDAKTIPAAPASTPPADQPPPAPAPRPPPFKDAELDIDKSHFEEDDE